MGKAGRPMGDCGHGGMVGMGGRLGGLEEVRGHGQGGGRGGRQLGPPGSGGKAPGTW